MVRRVVFVAFNAAIIIVFGMVAWVAIPGGSGWRFAAQPGPRECQKGDATFLALAVTSPTAEAKYEAHGTTDDLGILTGYVLNVQIEDGTQTTTDLPVESIFAGQVGALFVYSADTDKTGSAVHAIDLRTGCDLSLLNPADVVRAVAVDASGEYVYVKTVRRGTREDMGVWRYEVNAEKGERVTEPMPSIDDGPAWYTTLGWSSDGRSLVIDACGQASCATRILDLTTGKADDYLESHGQVIGVSDRELFAFAVSDQRPSEVLAINRADSTVKVVAAEVVAAELSADGETLWISDPIRGKRGTAMSRSIRVSTVLAASCAIGFATTALAISPTPGGSPPLWNQNQIVEYKWKAGTEPPAWMATAINDAAADSTASRKSKAANLTYDAAGASWISYTSDFGSDHQALGWTTYNDPPNSFHIKLRPHGYAADWGTLRWCPVNGNDGCYDPELVALHEFGHVQRMSHNIAAEDPDYWLKSIMQRAPHAKPHVGWNMHTFGPCDVARLQMSYEALTHSTLYSTCLSLDTTMWLSAPQGPHLPGTNVLFTATFKIASTEAATLAGDELDARDVMLQRRLVGASTWTSYASMSSVGGGTGQYRVTLSVSSTYEYRAKYTADSGEGLNGSSSSALEVVVDPCQLGPLVPCP